MFGLLPAGWLSAQDEGRSLTKQGTHHCGPQEEA
jgi:hypothetical protein